MQRFVSWARSEHPLDFGVSPVDLRTPDDRWIDLVSLLAYSLLDHVRIEVFRCAIVAFANGDSGCMPRADGVCERHQGLQKVLEVVLGLPLKEVVFPHRG